MHDVVTNFLKNDVENDILKLYHKQELMTFLQSMFIYENCPDSLDTNYLELYLHSHGAVVVGKMKDTDNLVCLPAQLCGDIDNYNNGTTAFGVSPVGEIRGEINKTIAFGLNNTMRLPSYDILITGNLLGEIDTSIKCCIANTRLHPIPITTDNNSKIAIDKALADIDKGKTTTVLSENVLQELENQVKTIDVINLTEVKNSDKIQYLTHAKDDIYRHFYTKFGQAIQGTGKMAQQTEMEINGDTSVSMILPYNMLKCRQDLVANINRIYSTNISVKFAKSWEHEFSNYLQENVQMDITDKGVNDNEIETNGLQGND